MGRPPLNSWALEIARLKREGLHRSLREIESEQGPEVVLGGRRVVMLCSNNYLGLANHPALREAAVRAIEKYGVGSGGARLISGAMTPHRALEERLAAFKRTEAALVYNSGYHANVGLLSCLVGPDDTVYSDQLNHASIVDGCRLARVRTVVYRHADPEDLARRLRAARGRRGRRLIVTDTVFSMDGDVAPLRALADLADRHGALLMVDEAHATGVFGPRGGGIVDAEGLADRVPIQMGTLGKALGCFGAYVAGSRSLIDYLINRSRSFIFTTALPPAVCAAAEAAVDLVERGTDLRTALRERIQEYVQGLREIGVEPLHGESPIFPVVLGENGAVMRAAERLLAQGVYAQGIRYPSVPKGTARLRTSLMATHTTEHIRRALLALGQVVEQARPSARTAGR